MVGGDIFDFGEGFVVVVVDMQVDDLELEVRAVVRVVWNCTFCGVWKKCCWKGCRQIL